ncbi:hypothetical protein TNIN_93161 [Trichonephila inaurata madagascariensis]|uniref:Uncharacterized protein n=1 Tax=Trichonephila inaurata madagascariensis TaxID=2747483 RepID=A0A8X6YHG6_9ARAC|nr:hypothetical protein TNIN_93161 [Trichonephila inaurata madagascariensis]
MLDGLPRNSSVLQTLLDPDFAGNDKWKSIVFPPPSNRQMVVFQHFSSPFDALTCTLGSDGVEDVRGTFRHTSIPLRDTERGCKPCHRASVEVNSRGGVY